MKTKNIVLYFMLSLLSMGFTACGDDKDPATPIQKPTDLTFDTDTVKIGVGETEDVHIKTGAGIYRVFSENPNIANAEIVDGKITVKGLDKGYTAIIVSDANDNYKRIPVKSLYKEISVDKKNINVKIPIGNAKEVVVTVLSGNGYYSAIIDSMKVVALSEISDNKITIKALTAGTAKLTITDMMGLKIIIPITVETTTTPYDDNELDLLKNESTIQYTFDGETVINANSDYYTYLDNKDNDLNLYGWDYYGYLYFKIWFDGDKSIGKKENSILSSKASWDSDGISNQAINFEIIKNDGTNIWAIYSFIKDSKLYYGNFCQKI